MTTDTLSNPSHKPRRSADSVRAATVMPARSRFAGQPIDTSSLRSIEIRSGLDNGSHTADDRVLVDYVYHEGTYWSAVIPLGGVDRVLAQAYNFSEPKTRRRGGKEMVVFNKRGLPKRKLPVLNHIQCRFVFSDETPVKLYPLGGDTTDTPAHEIFDLVYSVEAVGPKGYTYSLRNALYGHLVTAHRIVSMREMVFERLVTEDQYLTESPPLPLTADQRQAVLLEALRRSDRAGLSEPYYLFRLFKTNNCVSNPFQILDAVIEYSMPQRLASSLYRLPLSPRLYLRLRGMDSDPMVMNFVRDEFSDYISAPATRARREAFFRDRDEAQ